ncbi:hypothetical protein BD410DRAFT_839892 [Rickenella mellea]|uniref:Uncharacterized protein n=1 Tax=Rickenella mellea TaxID=50990 RepID=A0A4Y7Q5A2_9AGAM|nr:hypothetical protein BD410DRAFT_839892 [Rickenella mellea]
MPATRSQTRANSQTTRASSRTASKSSTISKSKSNSKASSKALDVLGGITKLLKKGKRAFGHGGSGAKQKEPVSTSSGSKNFSGSSNISDVDASSSYTTSSEAPSNGESTKTCINNPPNTLIDIGGDVPNSSTNANTSNYTKNSSFASAADCDEVDILLGTVDATRSNAVDIKDESQPRALSPLPTRQRRRRNWPMIVGDSSENLKEEDARPHSSVASANPTRRPAHTTHMVEGTNDVPVSSRLRSTTRKGAMCSDNGISAEYTNKITNKNKKSTKRRTTTTTTTTTEDGPASSTSTNGPTIPSASSYAAVRTPPRKIKDESLTLDQLPVRLSRRVPILLAPELSSESPSPYSLSSSSHRILSSSRFTSRSRRSKSPSPESPSRSTAFPHCPKSSSLRESLSLAPSPEIFSNRTGADTEEAAWTDSQSPIQRERRRWPVGDLQGKGRLRSAAGSEESFSVNRSEEMEERRRGKKRARDEDEVREESGERNTKLEGPRRGKRTRYAAEPGPSSTSHHSPHTPNAQLPSPHSSPSPISRSPTPPLRGIRRLGGPAICLPREDTKPGLTRKERFMRDFPQYPDHYLLTMDGMWSD